MEFQGLGPRVYAGPFSVVLWGSGFSGKSFTTKLWPCLLRSGHEEHMPRTSSPQGSYAAQTQICTILVVSQRQPREVPAHGPQNHQHAILCIENGL